MQLFLQARRHNIPARERTCPHGRATRGRGDLSGNAIVAADAIHQNFLRDVKPNYYDIVYFSKPADWRFQTTTPNAASYYIYSVFTTSGHRTNPRRGSALRAGGLGRSLAHLRQGSRTSRPAASASRRSTACRGAGPPASWFSTSWAASIGWAVQRGTSEQSTSVVMRVVNSIGQYSHVRLDGVDPFSNNRKVLISARPLGRSIDLSVPRSSFAEFPSCEIHLYWSEAAAADEAPTLPTYYLGVPDTTPEFANARDAETYLAKTLGR